MTTTTTTTTATSTGASASGRRPPPPSALASSPSSTRGAAPSTRSGEWPWEAQAAPPPLAPAAARVGCALVAAGYSRPGGLWGLPCAGRLLAAWRSAQGRLRPFIHHLHTCPLCRLNDLVLRCMPHPCLLITPLLSFTPPLMHPRRLKDLVLRCMPPRPAPTTQADQTQPPATPPSIAHRLKDLVLRWMPVSHNKAIGGDAPEQGAPRWQRRARAGRVGGRGWRGRRRAHPARLPRPTPRRRQPHQDRAALQGLHVDRQLAHHRLLLVPRRPAL